MKINKRTLHQPFTENGINWMVGWLNRLTHFQGTPATATDKVGLITQEGVISDLYLIVQGEADSGESLIVDVLVDGVSVLTAPYTFDDTTNDLVGEQIQLPLDDTKINLPSGSLVVVQRTLAGGSTITESQVVLIPTPVKAK